MDMPNARPNPYVGPRPFQAGEKLYGRDREIRELLDHFIAERIVLLYSPSGAGKTSLLSAGLIPELVKNGFQVLPTIRVSIEQNVDGSGETQQAADQGTGAASHANRYVLSTLLSLEEDLPAEQQIPIGELANLTILDYLTRRTSAKDTDQEEAGTTAQVLIFDQFEEVLTLNPTDKDGKTEFFAQVGAALRDRDRWALFVMREDYIGSVDPYVRPIPTRLNNRFRLDLLSEEAARQAMQQPANLAGVEFTDEAAIKLADDLRRVQVQQPDGTMIEQLGLYVEPVQLQVVCYRLWQLLPEETVVIGEPDLACLGDVNQSLAEYYAERVHLIAQSTEVRERLIRDWFQDKLITEHGIRSQVLKGVGQSDGLDNRAVVALENAYLIRAEKRRGVTWYELVHDRLIGPIRLNNEEWYATNLSVLQRQAARWVKEGQPDHLLLREQALEEAEVWAEGNQADLVPSELEYLEACRVARTREIEARELQNQAIKLEEQARSARRLRALLIVAVIAAIAAIVFAYFAFGQKAKADDNANRANAASTQAVSQQEIAEFNAGVAIAQRATADVAREIAVTQQAIADAASTEAVAQQATAVYNADLAKKNADEAARQASLASSRQLAAQSAGYFENNPSLSSLLAIESYLITDTWEAKNQLLLPLQRASAQQLYPYKNQIPPQPKDLRSVAISPDGKSLAFGSSDGKITLWNYIDNVEIWTKHAHESNRVVTLDFSPDGKYLASAAAGRILLWDLQNPDPEPEELDAHVFNVAQIAFDGTGEQLAAAVGKRFYAYNIADRQQIGESLEYKQDIFGVAWSPEGDRVAGPAGDGALIVWRP
ncbi:MAG: repeat, subgroup, partial [Chloroflexi bacterium]|nr:repeat, subgroup [Chloroflexota bacterium]